MTKLLFIDSLLQDKQAGGQELGYHQIEVSVSVYVFGQKLRIPCPIAKIILNNYGAKGTAAYGTLLRLFDM